MTTAIRVAVGCILLLVALIATAPATLFDGILRDRTAGRLRMTQAVGTIWRGNGALALTDSAASPWAEWPLRWTLSPWSLVHGQVAINVAPVVDARDNVPQGRITLSRDSATLDTVKFSADAAAFAHLLPLQAMTVGGTLSLSAPQLTWSPPANSGMARITWRNASLTAVERFSLQLGEVSADLVAQGSGLNFTLQNDGGQARVSGSGQWNPNTTLSGSLEVRLAPDAPADLRTLLAAVARPTADGGFRLSLPFTLGSAPVGARTQ